MYMVSVHTVYAAPAGGGWYDPSLGGLRELGRRWKCGSTTPPHH